MTRNITSLLNWLRKPASPRRPYRRTPRLWLERLEDRLAPATVSWNVDTSGDWNNPANWSTGNVPAAGDDVVINPAAAVTVTMSSMDSVQSISTGAGQTLLVEGGANLSIGSTGTNSTVTDNGTIELQPNANGNVVMPFSGNVTLTGTGVMQFDSEVNGNYVITYPTAGSTVTNAAGHTIKCVGVGYFGAGNEGTVVNQGIMEADGTGDTLFSYPSLLTNQGTLQGMNNGSVTLGPGGAGSSDEVDNSEGAIALDGGTLTVQNTTLQGGTLNLTNGSTLQGSGETLSGFTNTAGSDLVIPGGNNMTVTISGTITNNGTIELEPTTNYGAAKK